MRSGNIKKGREEESEVDIEWKIDEFSSFLNSKWIMRSPAFDWATIRWALKMINNSENEMQLSLQKTSAGKRPAVVVKFGIRLADGTTEIRCSLSKTFGSSPSSVGTTTFLKESEIMEKNFMLLPAGVLTVTCSITNIKAVQNSGNVKYENLNVLSSNLKALYCSMQNTDMTIIVGEERYPVHKAILAARSTVFSAMLQHKTEEANTGIIYITDSDPTSFKDFILFLYSGKIENLSCKNVTQLYQAAVKYKVHDLKELCLMYIDINSSSDHFFHIAIQVNENNDAKLMLVLKEHFNQKARDIFKLDNWEVFTKEHFHLANQFLRNMVENKEEITVKDENTSD